MNPEPTIVTPRGILKRAKSSATEHYAVLTSRCKKDPSVIVFRNKHSLCEDLKYVISMPELCDVIFDVGETHQLLYGVRAILSTRSRQFYQLFLNHYNSAAYQKPKTTPKKLLSKLLGKSSSSPAPLQLTESGLRKLTIRIQDFDPVSFRCLLQYAHCGSIKVGVKYVIGLMNAAQEFGFEDLRMACWDFAVKSINSNTVSDLIHTSKPYSHFKTTKMLSRRISEYIDREDAMPQMSTLQQPQNEEPPKPKRVVRVLYNL